MKTKLRKKVFGFEHKGEPLLSKKLFLSRSLYHFLLGMLIIFISLMIGVLGYHILEGFGWMDSLLNASMILGGMGPVSELKTDAGKFFASMYALFSGIVFLVTAGIIFAPIVHRFMHSLHISGKDEEE